MADLVIPVRRVTIGDLYFDLANLMSDEMEQVSIWTGGAYKNRQEFYAALGDEIPPAIVAAMHLAKWRKTGEKPRYDDKWRVNLDDIQWMRHVGGRAVDVKMEKDADGSPLLVVVDAKGEPVKDGKNYKLPTGDEAENVGFALHKDDDGNLSWYYTDTGEDVRPTKAPATSGSTGSPSTATKRERSASVSGTPTTDAA